MDDENIFDEIEDFLNDSVPNQNESSPVTATSNPSTPVQTSNINQYSPGGQGAAYISGAAGTGSSIQMQSNGNISNGCRMTTKAVLGERIGERLRNQLGGRGDHPNSGELKRKLDDGIGGPNEPIFNKAPKLEIKDEYPPPHNNGMIKTEIKEEHTSSQLEAILGLNSSATDNMKMKSEMQFNGGGGEMKSEYNPIPNKPPPTQGGLLQQALLKRDTGPNNNLSMFNECNSIGGRNVRMPGMHTNGLNGGKSNLDGSGGMNPQMDPQAKTAIFRLKELAKDPTLNHEAKQAEASKIIKENPKVVQFLKWMQTGKGNNQQRSLGNISSNDLFGSLQSPGCPPKGGMIGGNCDQHGNTGELLGHPDASINGGGAMRTGQQFSPGPQVQCAMQPGSPMNNFNESIGGAMGSHDIQKLRMQQQWEMQQQQVGGINQRLQQPAPNVMCGPQGGGVPTTQFVHGPGMGSRGIGPPTNGNGYGTPPGMNNATMNYQQAPNMIVGHNAGGQNWSLMRQQGLSKPPSVAPPNYPYRTPGNVRMDSRGNIRGISPTIGGYPTQSPVQSNDFRQGSQAFIGNCPPIRGNFPGSSNMNDQYQGRNPNNCYPNAMYGGPGSTQNIENGMPSMSVRLGFTGPHGDAMTYPNGGQGGPGLQEYVNMNQMQITRNGQNGGASSGSLMVSQGMGSPMGNPNEFSLSQQRGMMHPNNPNLVRPPGHHASPVAGSRTAIPHTSPMVQQHLVSQGNVNGIQQGINPSANCASAQRMMQVNGPNGGSNAGMFTPNNGLPPPNMTVPESDMQRFGPAPPPNYFNTENSNDSLAGGNANANFNPINQPGSNQINSPQQRAQQEQNVGGQVQNSFSSGGTNGGDGNIGNYSVYSNKNNGPSTGMGNNQQNFSNTTDSSSSSQPQLVSSGWKQNAVDLRKTLLTRLYQTLVKQGNPNAQQVAESVEREAFTRSSTQEVYTMKLAEWLANVFRQSGDGLDNNVGPKIEEQQQNGNNQQMHQMQEQVNKTVNPQYQQPQQQQQNLQMNPVTNVPRNDSPSTTSSVVADSTTLQEALSKVGTSNLTNTECTTGDISCKPELDIFSSGNTNENMEKELSADSGLNNMAKSSLSKTNPILADLLPANSKGMSLENMETSNVNKPGENEEMEAPDGTYNKSSTVMLGCSKENNSSVPTPNAGPPSNSSIYNMPSVSPTSTCSSSTSCSASSSSISSSSITTTSSSPQNSSAVDVRMVSASVSTHPTASSKPSNSTSMTFSGNQTKIGDSSLTSTSNIGVATTTTSSTLSFQSPSTFPLPLVDSGENGAKGQNQSTGTTCQDPVVSCAATITTNNICMTTTANKGSAMVTAVRRPSGKGINGQQSVTQTGQMGNNGSTTVLSSMSNSVTGQLPNSNATVTGQNNIQPHSVDSGIGSPRSIASSTLYSPKIQGTSPSLNPISETLTSSASPPDKGSS